MSAADANSLFSALVSGTDFSIPTIDLTGPEYSLPGGTDSAVYAVLTKLTIADVTTKEVNGAGTFDWFMAAFKAHLRDEYDAGRITGAAYVEAYIALSQTAMSQAVQFLISRDTAFWQAAQAQAQTITARVGLAVAKAQYASIKGEAYLKQAQFAQTKMQLPLVSEQGEVQRAQTLNLRTDGQTVVGLLGGQKELLSQQVILAGEQTEVQRAQTLELRTDGQSVSGVLGKQKELLSQQRISYMRDAEVKGAKLFADGWTVQKTADEGLTPPDALTNDTVNDVLQVLRGNLGLTV